MSVVLGFSIIIGVVLVVVARYHMRRRQEEAAEDELDTSASRLKEELERSADDIIRRIDEKVSSLEKLTARVDEQTAALDDKIAKLEARIMSPPVLKPTPPAAPQQAAQVAQAEQVAIQPQSSQPMAPNPTPPQAVGFSDVLQQSMDNMQPTQVRQAPVQTAVVQRQQPVTTTQMPQSTPILRQVPTAAQTQFSTTAAPAQNDSTSLEPLAPPAPRARPRPHALERVQGGRRGRITSSLEIREALLEGRDPMPAEKKAAIRQSLAVASAASALSVAPSAEEKTEQAPEEETKELHEAVVDDIKTEGNEDEIAATATEKVRGLIINGFSDEEIARETGMGLRAIELIKQMNRKQVPDNQ